MDGDGRRTVGVAFYIQWISTSVVLNYFDKVIDSDGVWILK